MEAMEARRALSHGHLPSWHDFPASWHAVQEYRGGALGDNADATGALFEAHDLAFLWDERSQKKGRAAVIVSSPYPVEIPSYRWVGIELADISWWVGSIYFLGAICWITNGAAACWPLADANAHMWLLGYTSIIGGSLFHLGAMLQYWEALNSSRTALFGYHLDEARGLLVASIRSRRHCFASGPKVYIANDHEAQPGSRSGSSIIYATRGSLTSRASGTPQSCTAAAAAAGSPASPTSVQAVAGAAGGQQQAEAAAASCAAPLQIRVQQGAAALEQQQQLAVSVAKDVEGEGHARGGGLESSKSISGVSSWSEWTLPTPGGWVWLGFRWRDQGFVAAFMQGVGTTIFLFACICGFPYVLPTDFPAGDWVIWDVLYWAPFLLGSCLFISSAAAFMMEVQPDWKTPQPRRLAWWINFLNLLGSIGFWLCSFFGFFAYPMERFQKWGTGFSCLWGSCFFLASAYLMMLEAMNKYPRPLNAEMVTAAQEHAEAGAAAAGAAGAARQRRPPVKRVHSV